MCDKQHVWVILLLAVVSSGCGPKTTQVSGTVTLNGKGLKDIGILMQPVSDEVLTPEAAFGKTDERGHFKLKTVFSGKNGLVPGSYSVVIDWKDPNPPPENMPPNACPYDIPVTAKDGSFRYAVESNGSQTAQFELSKIASPSTSH